MNFRFFYTMLASAILSFQGCAQPETNGKIRSLIELCDSFNINYVNILIDKGDYTLAVLYDTLKLKEYPVVFGSNPVDDKRMQGDNCTPEGVFKVRSKYPHKSWSKFIWIDYPNNKSWEKFNKLKRDHEIPGNAKIGGEIGIHGVPAGGNGLIDARINWTLGCISLKNKDVDEIYPYISPGHTIVTIMK